MRIGHGLYTANLRSRRGKQLIEDIRETGAVLEFQLTSNVRLNNLSVLEHHPLKQYLSYGISCVQGTDGGAIYGTDSIDEQLALERMLDLTYDDMLAMRKAEDRVLTSSMETFCLKQASFAKLCGSCDPETFLADRIRKEPVPDKTLMIGRGRLESLDSLGDQVREMPTDKVPVILLGGSFNTDRRQTRMQEWAMDLLSRISGNADPDKVFFVIGHRMLAYEKELVHLCGNRFDIYAMVPTHLTSEEVSRLKKSGVGIRISIEPVGMGLYKSFAYEIFKRRPSVVIALDGNSAGTNVIQEARNGKRKARIFINRHATSLYSKARTLRGYTAVIENADASEQILEAVASVWDEMQ
jgi:hypothetical protein